MIKNFDKIVKESFGEVLERYGFSSDKSKHSTFYRNVNDVWQFVIADPKRKSPTYDIKVFVSSPKIDPEFNNNFPDNLGIPSDSFCYLEVGAGIGPKASNFPCKDTKVFADSFEKVVRSSLKNDVIPFLEKYSNEEGMLSLIKHPYFKEYYDNSENA